MTIKRAWKVNNKDFDWTPKPLEEVKIEEWNDISEEEASRELANAHGDNALDKLKNQKTLESRFAFYTFE